MLEPPPVSDTNPEDIIQGYPWPASKLTKADMIRLTDLRERRRTPITTLLHDAVAAYYHVLAIESEITDVRSHDWLCMLRDVPTQELIAELQRRERIVCDAKMKKPPQAGQVPGRP